jgi:hypothetical protein
MSASKSGNICARMRMTCTHTAGGARLQAEVLRGDQLAPVAHAVAVAEAHSGRRLGAGRHLKLLHRRRDGSGATAGAAAAAAARRRAAAAAVAAVGAGAGAAQRGGAAHGEWRAARRRCAAARVQRLRRRRQNAVTREGCVSVRRVSCNRRATACTRGRRVEHAHGGGATATPAARFQTAAVDSATAARGLLTTNPGSRATQAHAPSTQRRAGRPRCWRRRRSARAPQLPHRAARGLAWRRRRVQRAAAAPDAAAHARRVHSRRRHAHTHDRKRHAAARTAGAFF